MVVIQCENQITLNQVDRKLKTKKKQIREGKKIELKGLKKI